MTASSGAAPAAPARRLQQAAAAILAGVARPALAVLAAMAIGYVVVLVAGYDPGEAYAVMLRHAFLTRSSLLETLERTVPLTFTGLAAAVSFRAGVFNVGAEGQLYLGAIAGFWVAWALDLPPVIHPLLALLAGAVAGALWALPPGIARAYWRADEVVSTIMLNYIAILFTSYLVARVFKDTTAGAQQTWPIAETARLLRLAPPSRLHAGLFLAIAVAAFLYWFLFRTSRGYEMRMVGSNPQFAEHAGIPVRLTMIRAMALSGALGGLAGIVEVLGIHWRVVDLFSPGYGFDGIVVALMAKNHPLGVLAAAFLYGGLKTGAAYMDRLTEVPKELNNALQGLLIFFVAAEGLFDLAASSAALRRRLGALGSLLAGRKEAA